jgi:REP element-mobilizing transposase RayT
MSNTYTQLHIHFVFAVKYRQATIASSWREELQESQQNALTVVHKDVHTPIRWLPKTALSS